jgi:SPASM domain peptide maturase of grasp-with-spasm system
MEKRFFILYSHNLITEGRERHAVYDLQHGNIHPIPPVLTLMIRDMATMPVAVVRDKYAPDEPELFQKYINFLLAKGLGFYTDDPGLFPPLSLHWQSPAHILHAVIEYHFDGYDITSVITQLDELLCRHVEFRLQVAGSTGGEQVLQFVKNLNGCIFRSVHLVIKYHELFTEDFVQELYRYSKKVNDIIIYNAPEHKELKNPAGKIVFLEEDFTAGRFQQHFSHNKYIVNMGFYTEALAFNPYYNRKVCIDAYGGIKNCLKLATVFGNVNQDAIIKVVDTPAFRELWQARPDLIETVRDSELRYCTYITNPLQKQESGLYRMVND